MSRLQKVIDLTKRVQKAYHEHRSGAIHLDEDEREILYVCAVAAKESLSKDYYQLMIDMINTAENNDGETRVPESHIGIMFALGCGCGQICKEEKENEGSGSKGR